MRIRRSRGQEHRFTAASEELLEAASGGWNDFTAGLACMVGAYSASSSDWTRSAVQDQIQKAGGGLEYMQQCKDDLLRDDHPVAETNHDVGTDDDQ